MTYGTAKKLVEEELQESVDCIESIAKIDPRLAAFLKVAILAGMSGGVKLAALNGVSDEHIAIPIARAIKDISLSLTAGIGDVV